MLTDSANCSLSGNRNLKLSATNFSDSHHKFQESCRRVSEGFQGASKAVSGMFQRSYMVYEGFSGVSSGSSVICWAFKEVSESLWRSFRVFKDAFKEV